ncbi:hypothetical protein HIM_00834 [Hirsutella minnesotensis 3608]|nr:hypothetical protein HIM_00834 [Hirsutella minnesotensis 3608]
MQPDDDGHSDEPGLAHALVQPHAHRHAGGHLDQPPVHRLPIIVAGVAYQGRGWIGGLVTLAWFFGRLMENGWPPPAQAPGLFITVGSVGFTFVALIGNARAIPAGYQYFAPHPTDREVLDVMATWSSAFLWFFALWLLPRPCSSAWPLA